MPETNTIVEQSWQCFERELASFVPDRVFDSHFEIWDDKASVADNMQTLRQALADGP